MTDKEEIGYLRQMLSAVRVENEELKVGVSAFWEKKANAEYENKIRDMVNRMRCEQSYEYQESLECLLRVIRFYAYRKWNNKFPGGITCLDADGIEQLDYGHHAREALSIHDTSMSHCAKCDCVNCPNHMAGVCDDCERKDYCECRD